MHDVKRYLQRDLSEEEAGQIVALTSRSFPDSPRTVEMRLQAILRPVGGGDESEHGDSFRYVIWEDGKALAHAKTFIRTVFVDQIPIEILALASVCSCPKKRGQGLGRQITKAAFAEVDSGKVRVSLFQTGVPEFYARLNCRRIENQIVNLNDKENPETDPFDDAHVMIYPSEFAWPEGVVNLNGDAY